MLRDRWSVRYRRWPQLWKLIQDRGGTHDDLLKRLADHYGWSIGQAYIATEWMFRTAENYN